MRRIPVESTAHSRISALAYTYICKMRSKILACMCTLVRWRKILACRCQVCGACKRTCRCECSYANTITTTQVWLPPLGHRRTASYSPPLDTCPLWTSPACPLRLRLPPQSSASQPLHVAPCHSALGPSQTCLPSAPWPFQPPPSPAPNSSHPPPPRR